MTIRTMSMTKRTAIPLAIQSEVLTRSRRRCCLCIGLNRDTDQKRGQIAHINGNPNDPRLENLAFLCLGHHDEYDGKFKQSKAITERELRSYQKEMYSYIEKHLALGADPQHESIDEAPVLMLEGDPAELRTQFRDAVDRHGEVLESAVDIFKRFTAEGKEAKIHLGSISPKNNRQNKSYFNKRGDRMREYSFEIIAMRSRLATTAEVMLKAFNRVAVVLSDAELANRNQFQLYQNRVADLRKRMTVAERVAEEMRCQIRQSPRSTQTYNRGKRVFIGSIDALIEAFQRIAGLCDESLLVIHELLELV